MKIKLFSPEYWKQDRNNPLIYYYKGSGYFPEIIRRVQQKIGKLRFVDRGWKMIILKDEDQKERFINL